MIDTIDGVDRETVLERGLPQALACTVTILNDDTIDSFSERVTDLLGFNHHKFMLSKDAWKEQVTDALYLFFVSLDPSIT